MTREEVWSRLRGVFNDVFDRDVELTDDTTANDVEDWDSLRQIALIGALEGEFSLHFPMKEITLLENVGDMVSLIERLSS